MDMAQHDMLLYLVPKCLIFVQCTCLKYIQAVNGIDLVIEKIYSGINNIAVTLISLCVVFTVSINWSVLFLFPTFK